MSQLLAQPAALQPLSAAVPLPEFDVVHQPLATVPLPEFDAVHQPLAAVQ